VRETETNKAAGGRECEVRGEVRGHERDWRNCALVTHARVTRGRGAARLKSARPFARRALRSEEDCRGYGVDVGGVVRAFRSVSPFAVTGSPLVGESRFALCPSVDFPLESVMPDCVWFFVVEESRMPLLPLMCELSRMCELSLMLDPLMLDPLVFDPLVFDLLMFDVSAIEPPVLAAPVVVVLVVVLDPLLIEPVLSPDVGATAPPAVAVSVVLALLFLLHAATATRAAARIAMRFMKSSGVLIIRERCATFSASMHSSTRAMRRQ
jgi:hypothetical protein